jgi:AraC-like DNA-binding protein
MEVCLDAADFLRAPIGRFVAGERWIYHYPTPAFCGFALWGRLTTEEMQRFLEVARVGLDRAPHGVIADARRLESVDPGAFDAFQRYVRETRSKASRSVARLAIVRSASLGGAVVTGFFGVEPPPYPVQFFDDPRAALGWLGVRDAEVRLAEVAAAVEAGASTSPVARDVQAYLARDLARATLRRAARALGISERTLQRRLAAERTSFQRELDRARVDVAQRLLLDTRATLGHVAAEIGCASLPSFTVLFRRLTGETPAAYRAARSRV